MTAGQRIDAPPTVAELGEVLANVAQAFRLAWPPADELLPGARPAERIAYEGAAGRCLLEVVLPFIEGATTLSYAAVALELRCDWVMGDVRLRARAALNGILDSRRGEDA